MKLFKNSADAEKAWTQVVYKINEADECRQTRQNSFKEKIDTILKESKEVTTVKDTSKTEDTKN